MVCKSGEGVAFWSAIARQERVLLDNLLYRRQHWYALWDVVKEQTGHVCNLVGMVRGGEEGRGRE